MRIRKRVRSRKKKLFQSLRLRNKIAILTRASVDESNVVVKI